jgi:molybdopterin molybdotransferase
MTEISLHCHPLPPLRVPLEECFGRVLRETVCAPEDLPSSDRSTRDGYAILQNDSAEFFQIVDTIHAADWKPRQLKPGEAVRVATGAGLPSDNLRVVMQENVERNGDQIRIKKREAGLNLRRRGEDVKAGEPMVNAGVGLASGTLALLATAGCTQPLVSPRLRVAHFTSGDEIIPPGQIPQPGQVRDSNSILIRSLLQRFFCDVTQAHLREDFEMAKSEISKIMFQVSNADVVLVSGGASVGDKDFTRPLLEWLGFEIAFSQVNVRPGRPLIFGTTGNRVALGLPGNPLSHFVCFHFAVAAALAKLTGEKTPKFLRGQLAAPLNDASCPRETLWPAQRDAAGLLPLPWASSGDVTCFATANALIRVPANCASMMTGAEVDFFPAGSMLGA